jgi:hypothetical protein
MRLNMPIHYLAHAPNPMMHSKTIETPSYEVNFSTEMPNP